MNITPHEVETIINTPESKNTMGDDEFAVQWIKILIGIFVGMIVMAILYQINHNLTILIKQNGEIINLLKR